MCSSRTFSKMAANQTSSIIVKLWRFTVFVRVQIITYNMRYYVSFKQILKANVPFGGGFYLSFWINLHPSPYFWCEEWHFKILWNLHPFLIWQWPKCNFKLRLKNCRHFLYHTRLKYAGKVFCVTAIRFLIALLKINVVLLWYVNVCNAREEKRGVVIDFPEIV